MGYDYSVAIIAGTLDAIAAVIVWLLVGLIAGWLAGVITRGKGYGCCADIVLGWVGAILGGLIMSAAFGFTATGFVSSIFVAFIGALAVLLIARLMFGKKS